MNKKSYVSPVLLGGLPDDEGDDVIVTPPSQDHTPGPGEEGYSF